jgi:catechol 2,3-dioxygenase-like lactoylglutathione lyase family enzyme
MPTAHRSNVHDREMNGRRRLIDHVSWNVVDLDRSRVFYEAALAALGVTSHIDELGRMSFGDPGQRDFGLYSGGRKPSERTHIAFSAVSRDEVDAFHAAAVNHGGTSLDAPRIRPEFGGLYSAYLLDPDGNVLEIAYDSAATS